MVVVPQASVAVAVPRALVMDDADGLHPRPVAVPPLVIVGAVLSLVHVIVFDIVEVLLHPSLAVKVLVCDRVHEVLDTAPSVEVIVRDPPQPSVAVALPRAMLISEASGLHPIPCVAYNPVKAGGLLSDVHVIVLDAVDVLPHASLAVNVLVCERLQLLLWTDPSLVDSVVGPHASVAVADPSALLISDAAGLQPNDSDVPFAFIVGGDVSSVHVAVRDVVELLLHASTAVNVLVCDLEHVLLMMVPSVEVMVTVLHASVADAVPRALAISEAAGLHPKGTVA